MAVPFNPVPELGTYSDRRNGPENWTYPGTGKAMHVNCARVLRPCTPGVSWLRMCARIMRGSTLIFPPKKYPLRVNGVPRPAVSTPTRYQRRGRGSFSPELPCSAWHISKLFDTWILHFSAHNRSVFVWDSCVTALYHTRIVPKSTACVFLYSCREVNNHHQGIRRPRSGVMGVFCAFFPGLFFPYSCMAAAVVPV